LTTVAYFIPGNSRYIPTIVVQLWPSTWVSPAPPAFLYCLAGSNLIHTSMHSIMKPSNLSLDAGATNLFCLQHLRHQCSLQQGVLTAPPSFLYYLDNVDSTHIPSPSNALQYICPACSYRQEQVTCSTSNASNTLNVACNRRSPLHLPLPCAA
jgi:hypothetical protein